MFLKNGLTHIDANIGESIMKANKYILNKISTLFTESFESFEENKERDIGKEREKFQLLIDNDVQTENTVQMPQFFLHNSFSNLFK
jgi:uncharacterized HAD superfamily protein